ncbi:MAG: FKBP-type peptidyl-prolyl cis-trans isomerase [Terracidiphilus sp.]
MKHIFLLISLAAATAASAQTPTKAAHPSASAAKSTATTTTTPTTSTLSPWIKLPVGVPRVVHGPVKIALALHYEDIKIGTGPEAESDKLWHVKYTGWRAADGVKFDAWDAHTRPVIGKDGKVVLGPDGKPKMGDPEPMAFPQGVGRLIPGFDYAVAGMRIGGKRRIFIPWQLAYGTRNIPDRPDHPGIPARSDLIFDVELVDVTDMPTPPQRPFMPGRPMPGTPPHPGTPGAAPGAPPAPGAPAKSPVPSAAPGSPAPPAAAQPSTPATQSPATTTPPQPK